MRVELTRNDLITRGRDCIGNLDWHLPQRAVGQRGGFFHPTQGANHRRRPDKLLTPDLKMFKRALGLRAP